MYVSNVYPGIQIRKTQNMYTFTWFSDDPIAKRPPTDSPPKGLPEEKDLSVGSDRFQPLKVFSVLLGPRASACEKLMR